MEKEVRLLRCSKLSCYTEFNKMVQALAHCEQPLPIPGTRSMHGTTSTKYNFYTTLIILLQQVVSNNSTDAVSQKRELQRLYEWFTINQPLIRPKTKLSARKPGLSFTSKNISERCVAPSERPHTAPAVLYKIHDYEKESTPERDKRKNTRPRTSFTPAYVTRSLGHNLDLIGQTFDQLEFIKVEDYRSPSSKTTTCRVKSPFHPFLANFIPPGFTGVQPHLVESVSFGELFSLAPGVAAQMTINREVPKEKELNYLRKILAVKQTPDTAHRNMNTPPVIEPTAIITRPQDLIREGNITTSSYVELSNSNSSLLLANNNSSAPHISEESCQMREEHSMITPLQDHDCHTNLPLESIAEINANITAMKTNSSSERNKMFVTEHPSVNSDIHQNKMDEVAKEEEANDECDSMEEDDKSTQVLPTQTSTVTTTSVSSSFQSGRIAATREPSKSRPPSVVSITFPAEKVPPRTRPGSRSPQKTPSIVAGFRKNRYQRPQTVASNHKYCVVSDYNL